MLEIKNISIAYNDRTVVEDVSFSVQPGETVSIVGESGSGKSTILRAVQGLLGREGWNGIDAVRNGRVLLLSEELLEAPGMNRPSAEAVYTWFHRPEEANEKESSQTNP